MRSLYDFFIKHKWKYLKGITCLLLVNTLQLAVPRITGNVVDRIQQKQIDEKGLLQYAAIIVLTSISIFILHYLSRIHITGASNLFEYDIRNNMFEHMAALPMQFYNKNGVGDLMALSVNDVSAVRMALGRGVSLVIDTVFLIIMSIIILSRTIDIRLTLLAFAPFPILVLIMIQFGKVIHSRFRDVQESFADLTRKTQENISGIRVIKAFVQENEEIINFQKLNDNNFEINMRLVRASGIFSPLISFISSLSYLIALIYGSSLVISKEITLGDFIAFNSYIGLMIRPVTSIGMIVNFVQRAKASMERINEFFSENTEEEEANALSYKGEEHQLNLNKGIKIDDGHKLRGGIEFRDLTFSYQPNQKPVLENINVTIEPGKTVGLIGRVGSGKSTLVHLLMRMYNPNARGQLFIDGMDIMDVPLSVLRENIGYVPQDNFLFSATIYDNIAFTPEDHSEDEVHRVTRISQVYDNIMEFQDKFDTILGERGVNLSGGQKQRVSIARALIKDPSILILDDCLSAVDTRTEENIKRELEGIMKSRTCIMIAHRISTIQGADLIIVLDQGRIVEQGTHQQLLDQEGYYYRMYQKQLLEDKIETYAV